MRTMLLLVTIVGGISVFTPSAAPAQTTTAHSDIEGTVVAARVGDISPWVDGMVNRIYFHPGQMVRKGDLFTSLTPLGIYQGVTENVTLSRTPHHFMNVLSPRGADQPEWLPRPKLFDAEAFLKAVAPKGFRGGA